MKIEDVIKRVDEQPRLQEVVDCLYKNKDFNLLNLKSLDSDNIKIAFYIIYNIYPENPLHHKHNSLKQSLINFWTYMCFFNLSALVVYS